MSFIFRVYELSQRQNINSICVSFAKWFWPFIDLESRMYIKRYILLFYDIILKFLYKRQHWAFLSLLYLYFDYRNNKDHLLNSAGNNDHHVINSGPDHLIITGVGGGGGERHHHHAINKDLDMLASSGGIQHRNGCIMIV